MKYKQCLLKITTIIVFFSPLYECDDILEAFFFERGENYDEGLKGDLHLKRDKTTPETDNITTQEHTFCVRYKPNVYESTYHRLYNIEFSEDRQILYKIREETDEDVFPHWMYRLDIYNPRQAQPMVFQERGNPSQWTKILADGGAYYISPDIDPILAGEWHHFCGGSSVKNMNTFFVQNGKTVYNWSQPESWGGEENYLSSNILKEINWTNPDTFYKMFLGSSYLPSYYITDFNIWGRALSTQEMYDFTTCKVIITSLSLLTLI